MLCEWAFKACLHSAICGCDLFLLVNGCLGTGDVVVVTWWEHFHWILYNPVVAKRGIAVTFRKKKHSMNEPLKVDGKVSLNSFRVEQMILSCCFDKFVGLTWKIQRIIRRMLDRKLNFLLWIPFPISSQWRNVNEYAVFFEYHRFHCTVAGIIPSSSQRCVNTHLLWECFYWLVVLQYGFPTALVLPVTLTWWAFAMLFPTVIPDVCRQLKISVLTQSKFLRYAFLTDLTNLEVDF